MRAGVEEGIEAEGNANKEVLVARNPVERREAHVLARFIGNYDGWDPWTKETALFAIREKKRYWCWRWDLMAYWASFLFFTGSLLFVGGSICSIFVWLHDEHSEWTTSFPYAVGSILYTVGAFLEVVLSIKSYPAEYTKDNITPSQIFLLEEGYGEDDQDNTQGSSSTPRGETCCQNCWPSLRVNTDVLPRHMLELLGSSMIFIGAVIYNLLCFTMVYNSLPETNLSPKLRFMLMHVPNVTGGVLFVTGSWCYWASAHHTWNPFIWYPKSMAWKVTLTNFLGSWGFFLGAAVHHAFLPVPGKLVSNWTEIFVGFTIGASMFLIGSYMCIREIANNAHE